MHDDKKRILSDVRPYPKVDVVVGEEWKKRSRPLMTIARARKSTVGKNLENDTRSPSTQNIDW